MPETIPAVPTAQPEGAPDWFRDPAADALLPDPSSLPRTGRRSQTTEECSSSGLQAAVLAPSTYAMPVPLPRGFA